MPEEVRALRLAAREPRPEDDVGGAALDRLDQARHLDGVVLEVGVLDHDDVAVDVGDPRPDGCTLAAVRLPDEHDPALALPALRDRAGPVGGAVVDDDHLLVERKRVNALEQLVERRLLVEGGDDEGDAHRQNLAGPSAQQRRVDSGTSVSGLLVPRAREVT